MKKTSNVDYFALILAYSPFLIILLGVFGNTVSFIVFQLNKDLKKLSSMMILSFVVISDTFSLFIWNLDHFYVYYFGTYYEFLYVSLCRIMIFIQYTSLQSSGWLLSLLCLDRFITVMSTPGSIYKKLPFSTPKSARNWSITVIIIIIILNFHILLFNGYYEPSKLMNETLTSDFNKTHKINNTVSKLYTSNDTHCGLYTTGFNLFTTWGIFQIYAYSLIPSGIMTTFNILVIAKTLKSNSKLKKNASKSANRMRRKLTISLLIITFLFMLMTLPSTIVWGFLEDSKSPGHHNVGVFFDFISFLNHTSIFWTCYFTNRKFKASINFIISNICCKLRTVKRFKSITNITTQNKNS